MEYLSLENFQTLLAKDEEERKDAKAEQSNRYSSTAKVRNSIEETLAVHGIASPIKNLWIRSIPDNLYACAISQPETTLVQWSSIPNAIKEKYSPNDQGIVEIPLAYLEVNDEMVDGTHSSPLSMQQKHARHSLSGNLTNKLSEYTRGATGQCRPFRAGGLDGDDLKEVALENKKEEDIFRSEKAIEESYNVLTKGSEACWEDESILTAPPGADFKVGISWDVVNGIKDIPSDNNEDNVDPEEKNPRTAEGSSDLLLSKPYSVNESSEGMWNQGYFDDDSLFGSSVSSSQSSNESDSEDEEQAISDEETDNTVTNAQANQETKHISIEDTVASEDDVSAEAEEVDQLLAELVLTQQSGISSSDVKKSTSIMQNPLELAERQALDQRNKKRKMWASTALLRIDGDIHSMIPNPAMTWPFTLDGFQQQAVLRLERSESVFVAAHTSAGKTVVAEYACALAKQRGTRCIYTSPIKALSNQKFRDFCIKFGAENVGLITGDLQINADDSTCLIMTTEILRSMLYRGADLIRDIEWVIFDEVHYINDSERGVVWEEVIIMLPSYVNLIFLSATTPNTLEFSDWIGRTKRKTVNVVKTNYRPVPLSHHLWAGLKLHKMMEGKSGFLEKGYSEAAKALDPSKDEAKQQKKKSQLQRGGQQSGRGGRGGRGRQPVKTKHVSGSKHQAWQQQGSKQNWMSLIRFLDREFLTPTVVFSFSKKKCEEIAIMLRSLDLNTAKEKGLIRGFTIETIARLSKNDADLPQVLSICEMVQRGVGIHHGGLLPILKEMVEILFSRNLIKVLFATETFAMGVNMPARSVVFNSIRKHDGTQFRVLEPGEYTQMAGRAGRRGLDDVGTVIMCCFGEEPPPVTMLRNMLTGLSATLRSQFRLTYNMILNLLRVEEMSVEGMIKRSFSEFATQRALSANEYPKLLSRGTRTLAKLEAEFTKEANLRIGAEDIEDYYSTCTALMSVNNDILNFLLKKTNGSGEGVLQCGRVILATAARKYGLVRSPAIILRVERKKHDKVDHSSSNIARHQLICLTLLPESFVNSETAITESFPSVVGSVGCVKHRYFIISKISLDQVLVISAEAKKNIVCSDFVKDSSSLLTNSSSQFGNEFVGKKNTVSQYDPFAGMMAFKGKKDSSSTGDAGKIRSGKEQTSLKKIQVVDDIVQYLVEIEEKELAFNLPVLTIRDCIKYEGDDINFRKGHGKMVELVAIARSYQSHRHPSIGKFYVLIERKEFLREKVNALQHLLSNESLQLFPDFLQRKEVLRQLGYVDGNETVCVKGRVACEVNTCDELILTEMVFEGILNDLEPEEIVAALSALVFQQKDDNELDSELPEKLLNCCNEMKKVALNLGQLQKEQGLEIDPMDYAEGSLKFGLVHVVYEWALGVPFSKICELTLVQEGSIVRCITRLDELCREVRNCSRVVGNPTLYRKMEAASVSIKRDIVFASSLYVS